MVTKSSTNRSKIRLVTLDIVKHNNVLEANSTIRCYKNCGIHQNRGSLSVFPDRPCLSRLCHKKNHLYKDYWIAIPVLLTLKPRKLERKISMYCRSWDQQSFNEGGEST
ncbi:hypothetical protein TNCV_2430641 [Trichonephila clavipes]|nr:hypothetical protein TNCV_2430641 [Trichonephila clavipes]